MPSSHVLFLCTGNSARSQMAEALLRKEAGDRYTAYSAGTNPQGVNPLTIKVLKEIGIDISEARSKNLTEFLGHVPIAHLVTVCDNAAESCPTSWPGVQTREHWGLEDPAACKGTEEEKLQKFREIRDVIQQKVKEWVAEMDSKGYG